MTTTSGGPREFEDEEYDVFAVMDAVPMVVRSVDGKASPFLSLLSAFLGIDSEYTGERKLGGT